MRFIQFRRNCEEGPSEMSSAGLPAHENVLPDLDLSALARRAALPGAIALAAVAALILSGGPLQAFADALGRALDADPRWVVAGAAFELLSFGGYIALLWLVGGRASERLDLRASTEVTLGGAAATRLLPTGGAGGAAVTIWSFRRAGLSMRSATHTLLTFLVLLYSVFLASIAVAGGLIALGIVPGGGPVLLSALPALGAVVAIGAALAIAARRPTKERKVPLGAAVREAITLVRSGDMRLLGAIAWWAFDAAVLWAMLHALGAPPSLAVVVLAYFLGQVANTIPMPGAVSGGMVGVLLAFGVEADLALAAVLAYRSIAIWLPAPIGLAALSGLRRTIARWGDSEPVQAPEPVKAPAWQPVALPAT
jgi:putative heme transporter